MRTRDREEREYAICANCIMDTTDTNSTFDQRGWCDCCKNYNESNLPSSDTDGEGCWLLRQ